MPVHRDPPAGARRSGVALASFLSAALLAVGCAIGFGRAQPAVAQQPERAPSAPASSRAAQPASIPSPGEQHLHMTLIAHDTEAGHALGGEGFGLRLLPGGRRYLFIAHESGPHCVSVFDVSDPARPRLAKQLDVARPNVRCNSLDVAGETLAVAQQTDKPGEPGAGLLIYDVADPLAPRQLAYFDTAGPSSRGVHHVWLTSDGRYAHLSTGAPDFTPKRPIDDQIYMIVDLRDRAHPREAGRWWYPGTRVGDQAPAPTPLPPEFENGFRVHNIDVFPQRPDRAYVGYLDGGLVILDIHDVAHPHAVSITHYASPGMTHTALPLFDRKLLVVSEEATKDRCADGPHRVTVWDVADETKPRLLSVAPFAADTARLCGEGGRYGAHNLHENFPHPGAWRSDRYVVGSFFAGGVRVFDIGDPREPREVAYEVPPAPANSKVGSVQINDVYVDDRGVIYAVDRFNGGLYVMTCDLIGAQTRDPQAKLPPGIRGMWNDSSRPYRSDDPVYTLPYPRGDAL